MVARHPELDYVLLLEPYGYGLARQARLPGPAGPRHVPPADGAPVRGRQRLPADPRRAAPAGDDGRPGLARGGRPQAVRARHRDAARRAGTDLPAPLLRRGRRRRGVDPGGRTRPPSGPRSSACCALGSPRTDLVLRRGGPGRGAGARPRRPPGAAPAGGSSSTRRRSAAAASASGRRPGLDAAATAGGPAGRTTPWSSRPTRTSTRRRPPTAGYDVVVDPTGDINDLLALTDILITDYSSSIVEFALLAPADHPARRRPRRRTRSTRASTSTTGPR